MITLSRRTVFIVAGAIVLALVVVVTIVLVHQAKAGRGVGSTLPNLVVRPESACGLPGTPGDSTAGAEASTWQSIGTATAQVSLPISASDGPGARSATGAWSCYSRTRSGAVLAGWVISARVVAAPNWREVVQTQTMPGPGQAALLGSVPNDGAVTVPQGFTIAAYTPDRSTIRYRLSESSATGSGVYSCTIDVAWSAGDWRLILGDDGSTASGCTKGVPDTFTPWGPK